MSIHHAFTTPLTTAIVRLLVSAGIALTALAAHAGVEINRASLAELETVKGIGPSLSTRILQARQQSVFANWDDLRQRVRGIGTAKAARLSSEGLTVGGAAYAATDSDHAAAQPKKRETSSVRASVSDAPRSAGSRADATSNSR
jgi:competence protein ComEA